MYDAKIIKLLTEMKMNCLSGTAYDDPLRGDKAEALNYAIFAVNCLGSDKYRWHDLRKNPDDLPPRAISITGSRICHESDEVLAQDGDGYNFIAEYNHNLGKWIDTADYMPIKKGRLIAWREIEPFEVTE